MCGIAGYIHNGNKDPELIRRMCDAMIHRGPDDEGYHIDDKVALGMRRLSIIDLATGTQPIYNEDRSIVTILNGEIYNYIELRNKYLHNHRFTTESDTEVLVHLYEELGIEFISQLNGMFAFVIWDMKKNLMLIVRDRLGIKPVYYYDNNNSFIFASEIKSILQHDVDLTIDEKAIYDYINLMYIPAPRTMFKHIKKLDGGCYIKISDGNKETKRYWELETKIDFNLTEESIIEELDHLFTDSIKLQLRSDVPVGTFLSGGIDSSAIVAYESLESNHRVNTYSVGFESAVTNELPYARAVAERYHTNHHELLIKAGDLIEYLPKLIRIMEKPHADSAMLPTLMLSELASREVKVILNGTEGTNCSGDTINTLRI